MLRPKELPKHQLFAIISLVCPLIAAISVKLVPLSFADSWANIRSNPQKYDEFGVGAMGLGIAEVLTTAGVLLLCFTVGSLFAVFSLRKQMNDWAVLGMVLNSLSFLILLLLILK